MKFSETPEPIRKGRIDYINRRWEQLYELEKEAGLSALQYLFLTNAGGAAAMLAFIGAIGADKIGFGAKLALASFVLGVVLLGISKAKQYHCMSRLFEHWKGLAGAYFGDKASYEYITEEDKKKTGEDFFDYFFPYASFACFVLGAAIGFYSLV